MSAEALRKNDLCLAVFGASGPTCLQVVKQGLASGRRIVAVTRTPKEYPLRSPLLEVVAGDVTDRQTLDIDLRSANAVISTFGVPFSMQPINVYSEGISNILDGMRENGIRRLVCVSSTGVSTEPVRGETVFWNAVVLPFFQHILGRTLYNDMAQMEAMVQASGLDWTIVRPAALFDTDNPTETYEVGPGRLTGRSTSRADLAQTLLRQAAIAGHGDRTIEVVSGSDVPSKLSLLRKALGH